MRHLLRMGLRFCASAEALDAQRRDEHVFQSVHWSIELVLKAYLRARGWTDARRAAEIRHDIAVALAVSEREGLEGVDDLSRSLVETLSHLSKGHQAAEFIAAGAGGYAAEQPIEAARVICRAVVTALDGAP